MVHFEVIFDFAESQVKLLKAIRGLNGKASQSMIDVASETLEVLGNSTAIFRLEDGKLVDMVIDDDCDCNGIPDARLSQQTLINMRRANQLFGAAEALMDADVEGDPCASCQISDLCAIADGRLCSTLSRDFGQMGVLLSAADVIQAHAGRFLRAENCAYDIAELVLEELSVAKIYLCMAEDFSISDCGQMRIADLESIAARRELIAGEVDDLLFILQEKFDLEPAVAVFPIIEEEE